MRFKKVQEHLTNSLKRKPRLNEIAKRMRLPMKRAKQLHKMVSGTSSLNAPVGEEGSTEFLDLIEDENIVSAVDELSNFLTQERINLLLEKMSKREQKILEPAFRVEGRCLAHPRDTAKHFGITRERVRQIESAAMRKMREMMVQQEKEIVLKQK